MIQIAQFCGVCSLGMKRVNTSHPEKGIGRTRIAWREEEKTMQQKKINAKELDIDLSSKQETEYFKWFLASLLFGKPIQQEVAKRTYFEFVKEGLITPVTILKAGWDKLVEVLDHGHYVRYDFSTATKLLDVSKALKEKYGTLTELFKRAKTVDELSTRLQEFKGVGPKTAEIFLRDIAPILYSTKGKE